MPTALRDALQRLWVRILRLRGSAFEGPDDRARSEARARFWAEFRKGRREADARSARLK